MTGPCPTGQLTPDPAAGTGSAPRIPRHRLLLLAGGGTGLLLGMYTGLARAGVEHRFVAADLHGIQMVLGFLGTLIALERAVALGSRWGYAAPTLSVAGVLALPFTRLTGGLLLTAAGGVVVATHLELWRRGDRQAHVVIMATGALAWVAAMVLWLTGAGPIRITPLLAAFLVLTIVGERLELSRLSLPSPESRRRFHLSVAVFTAGVVIAPFWRGTGLALGGLGLIGLVLWLSRYDLARRTIRRPGITRFAATCILAGYLWLAVSGVLWVSLGLGASGPLLHDALVHALFLGFVLSMVMGHAPIIVPAVLRIPLGFHPVAYLPVGLLHLSVAVRIGADLAGSHTWREVALNGNVTAIVVFVIVTVATIRRGANVAV